jgi:hypothetical protein
MSTNVVLSLGRLLVTPAALNTIPRIAETLS